MSDQALFAHSGLIRMAALMLHRHYVVQERYFNFFNHFMRITKNGQTTRHYSLLAFIRWNKIHPEKNYLLSPVTFWSPAYEPVSCASFLPMCRIAARCAQVQTYMQFSERPHNNGQAVITIPVQNCNML